MTDFLVWLKAWIAELMPLFEKAVELFNEIR